MLLILSQNTSNFGKIGRKVINEIVTEPVIFRR